MSLWVGNAGGRLIRNKFSIKQRLVFDTAGSTTKRRVPHPSRSWQRVGYATVGIEIRGIPPFAESAKDGAPRDFHARYCPDPTRRFNRKLTVSLMPVEVGGAGKFMRLSLRKAAHVAVGWRCAVGNPGRSGRKTFPVKVG
jgi:hypothetical protein